MKKVTPIAAAGLLLCATVYADEPTPAATPAPAVPSTSATAPQPALPTHVDTTVIGSSVTGGPHESAPPNLENDHEFVAGEPDLMRIIKRLNVSPKQQAQVHEVIEQSDAGAAVLIERDHDVRQMLAATTPADPQYAKLITDQSAGEARWTENRESLRRDVLSILTPVQQRRFEELQAQK